jgi:hypothetical protein
VKRLIILHTFLFLFQARVILIGEPLFSGWRGNPSFFQSFFIQFHHFFIVISFLENIINNIKIQLPRRKIPMKKWLISLIVPALIGAAPFSTFAATVQSDNPAVKFYNGVITVQPQQSQKERNPSNGQNKQSFENHDKGNGNHSMYAYENNRRERGRRRGDYHEDRQRVRERDDARYVINRTASVILRAQRISRAKHYYFGFARSVAHQNKARELFKAGFYRDAIFHSLRARTLAMNVIRGNQDNWSGYSRDDREERYSRACPSDRDLDVKIDWTKTGKDDAVVHIQFNFNLD